MSKQANKTLIGVFVIGAVILVVAGVIIFGSGKFFKETQKWVLYFHGSVKGLNVGAPVVFRGVKIGSVTDVLVRYDPSDLSMYIPVTIEIDPDKVQPISGEKAQKRMSTKELINLGLRAQLQLQSIVTGQLMINIDFKKDEPVHLTGIKGEYEELPTIPSDMEKLTRTLENIPFEEIFKDIKDSVAGLDRILNSPELIGSFAELENTLKDTRKFIRNIDNKIDPLVASFTSTSEAARGAFVQAEKTLALEEGVPGELASTLKKTLGSTHETLQQTKDTLALMEKMVAADSGLNYELMNTLHEVSSAARSVRFLTDYLDRHPEAMLRGKSGYKGE